VTAKDTIVCHIWGKGQNVADIFWVEARTLLNTLQCTGESSLTNNYLAQNVNIEKPGYRGSPGAILPMGRGDNWTIVVSVSVGLVPNNYSRYLRVPMSSTQGLESMEGHFS
jgi:hypothetical protein